MSRWKPFGLAAAALVLVAVTIAQALPGGRRESTASPAAAASPNAPGRVVAEGRVAALPGAEIVLSAEVAGTLVELPVEELARVRRGQLVAALRADDWRAELASAHAKVEEANAEVALAEVELERSVELYAKQIDTLSRRDRAARDLDVARARVVAARATIGRIQAELAKRRLAAPIDGVVVARPVDLGETIEARTPIATIVDLGRLRVEAEVDEFDAARVTPGAAVEVTAEGWDGRSWRGVVDEIPDVVGGRRLKPQDPGRPSDTRVLLVKVRLEEPTPLKLGQRVEVSIAGAPTR